MPLRSEAARRLGTAIVLAVALLLGCVAAPASYAMPTSRDHHGHLTHRKEQLGHQINATQSNLDEMSSHLVHAAAAVHAAVTDLAAARARRDAAVREVQRAARADHRMQIRLRLAVERLHSARRDLASGRRAVVRAHGSLVGYAVASYQSGGAGSAALRAALSSANSAAALSDMEDATTVLDAQAVRMQRLQAARVLLVLNERRVAASKREVAAQRVAAALTLLRTEAMQRRAMRAQRAVVARLAGLRAAQRQILLAKRQEAHQLQSLQRERRQVVTKLQAIARRRARLHHASMTATVHGNGFLSYPIPNTYITSPFGMRMNPVIHVWELHDGTDFAANCGTPVHAAAAGTVTSEYFNTGYGNQLLVDHGFVRGVSLWTSYNHLSSFVAHVGEHVRRGQLIAYSGTTGYSTGCHLHFMVYVNGVPVNPMGWL